MVLSQGLWIKRSNFMAVKLKSGFEILRYSDLSYDRMTAEIQYKGEQVVQINMDKGLDNGNGNFY